MMKRHVLSKTTAVLCAAAAIACCTAASAAELTDAPAQGAALTDATENATEPETAVIADYYDYGYDYYGDDYDYHYDHYERKESKQKDWLKIILIALGISVVATGITVYIIYRGYKYNGMTEPYEYKNKAGLDLAVREDNLVDVHVTSVHINRDQS